MNKTQLIKQVAKTSNIDESTVRTILNNTFDIIQDSLLKGINVQIAGFIHFVLKIRKERVKNSLNDKGTITIPKHYYVKTILPRAFVQAVRNKTVY